MIKLDWKTCLRVGISIFLIYLSINYWQTVARFISVCFGAALPIVIGGVIAYLINILMHSYEKWYFPGKDHVKLVAKSRRIVCLIGAILTFIGVIFLLSYLVVPELVSCIRLLLAKIPPLIDRILAEPIVAETLPNSLTEFLDKLNTQDVISKGISFFTSGIGDVLGFVSTVFSSTVTAFLSIIFAVYMLIGKERLGGQIIRVMRVCIPEKWNERLLYAASAFNNSFRKYFIGQCTEAVILGVLCTIGMLIFRFPYATMIGALIGFTALIPVAGAYIGAGVGALMILTESPIQALLFVVYILVLQQLEGNLIYPRVVGTSVGLPAIWVLAAVTVGGALSGVLGMLLGVPVVATLYRILRETVVKMELDRGLIEVKTDAQKPISQLDQEVSSQDE